MVSIFKSKAKKQKVAGNNRYFDRTYYFQTNPTKQKFSNRDYENFAYDGYMSNVVVYRAINMISRAISSIGLSYFEINDNKKIELNEQVEQLEKQHVELGEVRLDDYTVAKQKIKSIFEKINGQ